MRYPDLISKKIISSLQGYLDSANATKLVVGLSGGIDSAVAAKISVEAVGKENVSAFFMPYTTSSSISQEIAYEVSDSVGMELATIDITEVVDTYCKTEPDITPLRKGNIMARIRMINLFDKSQKLGALVAGTSNKTECLLGYGTWYGDTASSVNLLGTLYKHDVYALARYYGLPISVIDRIPSADLWDGQTDEDEMGFSYADVDKFFYSVFELNISKDILIDTFGIEFVTKVANRTIANEFKRNTPFICGSEDDFTYISYADIIKEYI